MPSRSRDPRTKEELLDRMMSRDFDGDIKSLGAHEPRLVRTAPNRLELQFPDRTYELVARIPRAAETRSFAKQEGDDETWTAPPADEPKEAPKRRQRAARGEARS